MGRSHQVSHSVNLSALTQAKTTSQTMLGSVPTGRFALLNHNSGEVFDPEAFYLDVLQAPASSNEYVGYADYVNSRENTRDHIRFSTDESRTSYCAEFVTSG